MKKKKSTFLLCLEANLLAGLNTEEPISILLEEDQE